MRTPSAPLASSTKFPSIHNNTNNQNNDDFAFLLAQSRAMLDAANADDEDSVLAALRTTKPITQPTTNSFHVPLPTPIPSTVSHHTPHTAHYQHSAVSTIHQPSLSTAYDPLPPPPPPPPRNNIPATPSLSTTDNHRVPIASLTALDAVLNRSLSDTPHNPVETINQTAPVVSVPTNNASFIPSSTAIPSNPYTYGTAVSTNNNGSSVRTVTPLLSNPFPTYSVPSNVLPLPVHHPAPVPTSSGSTSSTTVDTPLVHPTASSVTGSIPPPPSSFHQHTQKSSSSLTMVPHVSANPSSSSSIVSGSTASSSTALVALPKNSLGQPPVHVSSAGVLALPRSTLSTRRLISQYGDTIEVYLASLPRNIAIAIRELIIDILHLRAKRDTMLIRVMNDRVRKPSDPMPEVLVNILEEIEERERRITNIAGEERTGILLQFIEKDERNTRIGMGLPAEPETEEDLGNTVNTIGGRQAAVFRRRLDTRNVQPARKERPDAPLGGVINTALDGINADGSRQLFTNGIGGVGGVRGRGAVNDTVSRRNGTDNISYYARQQQRYGRGRRGSTSIASAWQQVFASAANNNQETETNNDNTSTNYEENYNGTDEQLPYPEGSTDQTEYTENFTNEQSYPATDANTTNMYHSQSSYPEYPQQSYVPNEPPYSSNHSYATTSATPSHPSVSHAGHTFSHQLQSQSVSSSSVRKTPSDPSFDIDSMLADATALMALLRSNQSP